jgi:phytoene/squalene synthetase
MRKQAPSRLELYAWAIGGALSSVVLSILGIADVDDNPAGAISALVGAAGGAGVVFGALRAIRRMP